MLRTTFHMDMSDVEKAYMAVQTSKMARPEIEIVHQAQSSGFNPAWRRGFDLSKQFPVRWIISMDYSAREQSLTGPSYTLYAVGHHIAVDGVSMSMLSKELLQSLRPQDRGGEAAVSPEAHVSLTSYGEYIHQQVD